MNVPNGHTDFFISYRGSRSDWALWINWVVRSQGYTTVVMAEFKTGEAWTRKMREGVEQCGRLIPVYSPDYWDSGACIDEFDAY